MKKKKIDNNSKFLFMMSGFFVLLFAMVFASTELGKVTYSANTCDGHIEGDYCCNAEDITRSLVSNVSYSEATNECSNLTRGYVNGYYFTDCYVDEDENPLGTYNAVGVGYSGCVKMISNTASCSFDGIMDSETVDLNSSTTFSTSVAFANSQRSDYNLTTSGGGNKFTYAGGIVTFAGSDTPGTYSYTITYTKKSDSSINCSETFYVTVRGGNTNTGTNPGNTTSEPEFTCPNGYDANPNATQESECYLITNPGYYVRTEFGQQEICPKGKYCIGGIKIYAGNTGGAVDCGRGYTTIDVGSTRSRDCVMDCSGTKGAVDNKNRQPFTFTFSDIVYGAVARSACCSQNNGYMVDGEICYVCRTGYSWSTNHDCCVKTSECTSDNCVNYCDNSTNGRFNNQTTAEQEAKETCGINNYGISQNSTTECYSYTCTCVADRNEYKTEALRDAAILRANCKNGVNMI